MDIQSDSSKSKNKNSHTSRNLAKFNRNLFALIGEESCVNPYRSKFQLNSIGSGKSRQSRDSDLLNRLAKESSKASSKSLNRKISQSNLEALKKKKEVGSSNSNSGASQNSGGQQQKQFPKIQAHMMAPKIHNCVCFVAGECLNYNCNCFLSPFPCAPECCPNCLHLKTNLPHKITNMCSCKKTRCLKLYCECLSKGIYCGVMCRCQRCENHESSASRMRQLAITSNKGCACQKSECMRNYCECYANKLKCTNRCGCFNCKNMLKTQPIQAKQKIQEEYQRMQEEEPQLQFQQIDFFGGRKK